MEAKSLDIGWKAIGRILVALFFVWVVFMVRDSIAAFLLAIVISLAFDPIVDYLERKSIPRIISTIVIFILAILLVAIVIYIVFPLAVGEIKNLIVTLSSTDNDFINLVRLRSAEFTQVINANLDQFINNIFTGNSSLIDLVGKFFGGVFLTITTLVLSFYLTVGKDAAEKFLRAISPHKYDAYIVALYQRIEHKISLWLLGQLMLSVCVGVAVFLGLQLLGVPYSLTLGILAAILELVPFVGPIFVGALAILIALNTSTMLAFYVFLLFVAIQQIENHILVPFVHRFTTGLSPVVIIISMIVFVKLTGAIGIFLAIPIALFITELIDARATIRHPE